MATTHKEREHAAYHCAEQWRQTVLTAISKGTAIPVVGSESLVQEAKSPEQAVASVEATADGNVTTSASPGKDNSPNPQPDKKSLNPSSADKSLAQQGRLYANWSGPNCWLEYERLADAVGLWQSGSGKLSRDRAREIAVRLGTELTEAELDRLYDDACGFVGDVWEYRGTDAGGLWMVASGLPDGERIENRGY